MQASKLIGWGAIVLSVTLVSACNLGAASPPTIDPAAIQTQAMQTVNAQFVVGQSQTAAAAAPTSLPSFTAIASVTRGIGTPLVLGTPLVGFTPLTTPFPTIATLAGLPAVSFPVGCNDAKFVGETKPYDQDEVVKDKQFSKAWMFENNGTCTWDAGYAFVFREDLSTPGLRPMIAVRDIKIGVNDADWTKPGHNQTFVIKITPELLGEYKGFWQMRAFDGNYFGSLVYVWVKVVAAP
ncbi:MAG: hypothetical protein A2Y54_11025 [Chloroflexi bacterium RBG_16_51_16]|nr:MAG: hypothetical protein A2Y54_11025 [Chloroflexi bacterium RBG_16_51_16]